MSDFKLVHGDMRGALQAMEKESIDAIVCDPPYELGFMGKTWDSSGVAFNPDTWAECYRVLKEGGRLLAFGGTRTHHRIWCAIEDAGFVIEDTVSWFYGSGFPKHRSKLKPGHEPICVARKGRVSELNIDGCRIGTADTRNVKRGGANDFPHEDDAWTPRSVVVGSDAGRWPANVVLDEDSAAELDEQSGTLVSGANPTRRNSDKTRNVYGAFKGEECIAVRGLDIGGASRFYYCAKPDRGERDFGLEGQPKKVGGSHRVGTSSIGSKDGRDAPKANHHPTVKPVDLMRWLVRLVSVEGQTVLDPFTGSGTTGVACIQEGRNFVGVELSEEYMEIARKRIGNAPLNLFGVA